MSILCFLKMVMIAALYLDNILSNLTHNYFMFFHAKNNSIIKILLKDIDHSMYVSGLSCTPVVSVISLVLSGYRYVPQLVHSGLLLLAVMVI